MKPFSARATSLTRIELAAPLTTDADARFEARYADFQGFLEKQEGMLITQLAIGHENPSLVYESTRWETTAHYDRHIRTPEYIEHRAWLESLGKVTTEVSLTCLQVSSKTFFHST